MRQGLPLHKQLSNDGQFVVVTCLGKVKTLFAYLILLKNFFAANFVAIMFIKSFFTFFQSKDFLVVLLSFFAFSLQKYLKYCEF